MNRLDSDNQAELESQIECIWDTYGAGFAQGMVSAFYRAQLIDEAGYNAYNERIRAALIRLHNEPAPAINAAGQADLTQAA
jgi:hypothetical protein